MAFPEPPPPVDPTPLALVDAAIDELHAKKDAWREVSPSERAALLDRCVTATLAVAARWAAIGASIKGLEPDDTTAGEEWVAGIYPTIRNARLLASAIRAGGAPKPASLRERAGRTVARVMPETLFDKLMFAGVTADVWIEPGRAASQGAIYREKRDGPGKVCLILGGGNVSSIPPMDAFYKLFVEDEVVLLKMNPVNEALGPVLAEALAPLVDQGVLRIVYGGAEVGAHAAAHEKIGSLHVTGSDRTYDAIVWGKGGKAKGVKANDKPFTAELGCVTPILVVPGPWSSADVRYQARHVASMITQNASFNCNAGKVVVTARGWLQRQAFLDALHDELRKASPRKAYYPGARARYEGFLKAYPHAVVLGSVPVGAEQEVVPWTAIPDVPAEAGGYALTNEAFCGVVAEVTLDLGDEPGGPNVERFLERAVAFANDHCWGTLSCCVLVHPETEDDHTDAVAKAVAELRYGGVGVNVWPGVIYALVSTSWGAYPGHTPEDIQSGTGVVHNSYLFDHPEKSVVHAPFRMFPTPLWFHDHRNLLGLGRALVKFEASQSWGDFLRVVGQAIKG